VHAVIINKQYGGILHGIKKAGYPLYTPVLITNSDEYESVASLAGSSVKAGDDLLQIS
jgi:PTS system beta-glucosides-specific IIC component